MASRPSQKAVVMGSEYLWVIDAVSWSVSIIWRTDLDNTTASGWSGYALCIGKSMSKYAKALFFKTFKNHSQVWMLPEMTESPLGIMPVSSRAGLCCPPRNSGQQSEISRGEPAERIRTRNWASNPWGSRYSGENERRNLGSPSWKIKRWPTELAIRTFKTQDQYLYTKCGNLAWYNGVHSYMPMLGII